MISSDFAHGILYAMEASIMICVCVLLCASRLSGRINKKIIIMVLQCQDYSGSAHSKIYSSASYFF